MTTDESGHPGHNDAANHPSFCLDAAGIGRSQVWGLCSLQLGPRTACKAEETQTASQPETFLSHINLLTTKACCRTFLNNRSQAYHEPPRWMRSRDSRKASRTNTQQSRGMDDSRDNNITDTEAARWVGKSPHLPRAPFSTQRSSWAKLRTRFATPEDFPRFRGSG